jgi:Ca-activated chloride channel family protein
MFSPRVATVAAIGALALTTLGAQEPQRFKSSTDTVPLYVTVTDRERRLITDLLREDFEVYDNGKLQELTTFDNTPTPITVVAMIDTSASMTLALDRVKQAAEQFLIRLLPADRAKVGAFNDKIEFLPESDFTGNRDQLIRALKELDYGNGTHLYDAIDEAITLLGGVETRKVILALTDGEDFGSRAGRGDVVDRARAENVMVYSIGLETVYFNGQSRVRSNPDRVLRSIADETGGGFYNLKESDDLGATFTRVAQELHSQYVLGFTPQVLDGKVHKLEVRLKKPGLTARARRTYVAGGGTGGSGSR